MSVRREEVGGGGEVGKGACRERGSGFEGFV